MFTTHVFIRKNTLELRQKLNELWYEICPCSATGGDSWLYNIGNTIHAVGPEEQDIFIEDMKLFKRERVDCGTNDKLFLALAALRDDSDIDQLFTNDRDWTVYRDETREGGLCGFEFFGFPSDFNIDNYHKATKEEIIEYFKQKSNG